MFIQPQPEILKHLDDQSKEIATLMKTWKSFLKKKIDSVQAERKFAATINSLYKNEKSEDILKWITD